MLSSYLITKIFQKLRFPIVTMAQETASNKTCSSQAVPGATETVTWKLKNWMQYSALLVQRARCVMEVGGGVGDEDSPKTILCFKLKETNETDFSYRDGIRFKITNIYYGLYVNVLNDDIKDNPVSFKVRGRDDFNELDTDEIPITVSDNKEVCIDGFLIYVRRQQEGPHGLEYVEPLHNGSTVLAEDTEELNIKITVKMFKVKEEGEEESAAREVMDPASVLQKGQKLDEFGEYLEEAHFCDVKLKMSDEVLLPAHRIILSSRSSVFKAMLTSDMKESKEQVIGIPDMGSEAMKIILRHIYTGEVEFNLSEENGDGELMKQVVYGANKYNLPKLLQHCDKVAIKVVNFANAWELLKLAKMHNMPRATEDLEKFVQKNCLDILEAMGANQI